jgi:hypothetical protein
VLLGDAAPAGLGSAAVPPRWFCEEDSEGKDRVATPGKGKMIWERFFSEIQKSRPCSIDRKVAPRDCRSL